MQSFWVHELADRKIAKIARKCFCVDSTQDYITQIFFFKNPELMCYNVGDVNILDRTKNSVFFHKK